MDYRLSVWNCFTIVQAIFGDSIVCLDMDFVAINVFAGSAYASDVAFVELLWPLRLCGTVRRSLILNGKKP